MRAVGGSASLGSAAGIISNEVSNATIEALAKKIEENEKNMKNQFAEMASLLQTLVKQNKAPTVGSYFIHL